MTTCFRSDAGAWFNYPFLTLKERDNETGLDYFLARYYSSSQGRFTSPDEFTGGPDELYDFAEDAAENPTFYAELDNPQSLNKYQYTYNNPLNMVDPDGHCPPCFGPSLSGTPDTIEFFTNPSRALDKLQLKISVIGMAPVVGDAAEIANIVVSGIRGNYTEALIDAGGVATGSVGSTAVGNRIRKLRRLAKADGVVDAAVHGNSAASTKAQHLYELVDQTGDVKKVGVSGQQLRQNGTSPRAHPQANQANKTRSGTKQIKAVIRKRNVEDRKKVLELERKQAEKRRKQGHSMEMHKRP